MLQRSAPPLTWMMDSGMFYLRHVIYTVMGCPVVSCFCFPVSGACSSGWRHFSFKPFVCLLSLHLDVFFVCSVIF